MSNTKKNTPVNNDPAKTDVDVEKLRKVMEENDEDLARRLVSLLHDAGVNIDKFINRINELNDALSKTESPGIKSKLMLNAEQSYLEGYRRGYTVATKKIKKGSHKKKKKQKERNRLK